MANILDPMDLIFGEDYVIWEEEDGRRARWVRERTNFFEDYDNTDFVTRFRLGKTSVLYVLEQIEQKLEFPSYEKNYSVSPINQLLLTLRYYATGCTQLSMGDFSGFSVSTANRIVHRVSAAIADLGRTHIRFPESQEEILRFRQDCFKIASFPRVIGAIDCTHVKIRSLGGNHAEFYRNRKGYFSLNCQAICNSKMELLDLVARWPGSAHDATIFNNFYRKNKFDAGHYGNAVLVGDSGYASRSYMMTPLRTVSTHVENLYVSQIKLNESQIRTRNVIERFNGLWKRRFPVLALGLIVQLPVIMDIIVATGVLHNIAIRAGELLPPDDVNLALPAPWETLLREGEMNIVNVEHVNPNRNRGGGDLARVDFVQNYFYWLWQRNQQRPRQPQTL